MTEFNELYPGPYRKLELVPRDEDEAAEDPRNKGSDDPQNPTNSPDPIRAIKDYLKNIIDEAKAGKKINLDDARKKLPDMFKAIFKNPKFASNLEFRKQQRLLNMTYIMLPGYEPLDPYDRETIRDNKIYIRVLKVNENIFITLTQEYAAKKIPADKGRYGRKNYIEGLNTLREMLIEKNLYNGSAPIEPETE